MSAESLFGGIEAGGTKFVCAVGGDSGNPDARIEFPTTSPPETIGRVLAFFEEQARSRPIVAIGVASFGPVDLNSASPHWGYITSTPKEGWRNVDLAGPVKRAFGLPVAFDTDVNAAALGERRWGAARGLDTFVYVTVGTGIGGGGMVSGQRLHGVLHPEMGHMRIAHDFKTDPFPGACPYHGDCWEGLAAGSALEARWGGRGQELPADHPAWELEAHYLALGVTNLVCTLSPQRIILGGGVMRHASLFPPIRRHTLELLNNYIQAPEITRHIDEYIVPPQLGDNAGVLGAIALAIELTG
ncbi:MAG TPA: ROK family protein [Terriglobia bacterium]|jgi:fructokinase|nr:ROK family protein [Terriglobia bacterium]